MTRQLLFQNSTFWNVTPCMCMSHIQAYSLFFIVLGRVHDIHIFRFFHFFWPFGHNIQWFFKIFVSAHILLLKNRFSVYKTFCLTIIFTFVVLKEGVRIQGENSKKFLKLQLRIRPGGFDLKFKFKELYVGNSKVHLWFKTFGNFWLVDTQLFK